jgi:outer membrane protein W
VRTAIALVATVAVAHADPDRLYFRAGAVHVTWLSQSHELALSGVSGPASLAISDGPVAGSGAELAPLTTPAVIVGYVLPFARDRISVETVLGAPLHVKFRATGTLANESLGPMALGLRTGIPPLGSDLGETDAAPPIVTAVYRLADLGPVHPYAGAGLAVLISYNSRATNPVLTEVAPPTFHVDPAPGLVLQTGVEVRLWKRLVARADVKYVALMKAHTTVEHIQVRTPDIPLFDTVEVGTATMDVWLNPLVVQLGIGLDF